MTFRPGEPIQLWSFGVDTPLTVTPKTVYGDHDGTFDVEVDFQTPGVYTRVCIMQLEDGRYVIADERWRAKTPLESAKDTISKIVDAADPGPGGDSIREAAAEAIVVVETGLAALATDSTPKKVEPDQLDLFGGQWR